MQGFFYFILDPEQRVGRVRKAEVCAEQKYMSVSANMMCGEKLENVNQSASQPGA